MPNPVGHSCPRLLPASGLDDGSSLAPYGFRGFRGFREFRGFEVQLREATEPREPTAPSEPAEPSEPTRITLYNVSRSTGSLPARRINRWISPVDSVSGVRDPAMW